jgi:hypothetical protein
LGSGSGSEITRRVARRNAHRPDTTHN